MICNIYCASNGVNKAYIMNYDYIRGVWWLRGSAKGTIAILEERGKKKTKKSVLHNGQVIV